MMRKGIFHYCTQGYGSKGGMQIRSIVRILALVAVVFGGLLKNGIQPARADDTLQAGTYQGMINLAFHSRATQSAQGASDSASINWIGEGQVELTISGEKYGTLTMLYFPVDVFDNGYINAGGCNASVGIKAKGSFSGGTAGLNFDPKQKTGTLYLIWNGLDGIDIVWDDVQGTCKKKMSEAQITAINETSPTIGQITLTVNTIDSGFISGDCRLPTWEGGGPVQNGSYAHIIDSCNWWAKMLEGQKKGGNEWTNK
jgi:hypothetical protein